MANNTLSVRHKMACRSYDGWNVTPSPVPLKGEICLETIGTQNPQPEFYQQDPNAIRVKIGNGSTPYKDLPYLDSSFVLLSEFTRMISGAMKYKGIIGTAAEFNALTATGSGTENGDVWKFTADIDIDNDNVVDFRTGDTVIFKVNSSNVVTYDIIPSGDDLEYRPVKVNDVQILNDETSSGFVNWKEGTTTQAVDSTHASHIDLAVSTETINGNNVGKKITISHRKPGAKDTSISKDATNGKYISAVEVDGLGHVKSVSNANIPIVGVEDGSTTVAASATEWIKVADKTTTSGGSTTTDTHTKVISHRLQDLTNTGLNITGSNTTVTIGANTKSNSSLTATLTNAEKLVIPQVTIDKAGHITVAKETVVTLKPSEYYEKTDNPVKIDDNATLTGGAANPDYRRIWLEELHPISPALTAAQLTARTAISGGSSTKIPTVRVDKYGRVIDISESSITIGNAKLKLTVGGVAVTGNDTFNANSTKVLDTDGTTELPITYDVPKATSSVLGVIKEGSTDNANRKFKVSVASDGAASVTVDKMGPTQYGIAKSSAMPTANPSDEIFSVYVDSSDQLKTNVFDFTGATTLTDGTHGLVPAPKTADASRFLKGDGTWADVIDSDTKYKIATGAATSVVNTNASEPFINLVQKASPDIVDSGVQLCGQTIDLSSSAVPASDHKLFIDYNASLNKIFFALKMHKIAMTGKYDDLTNRPGLHQVNFYSRFSRYELVNGVWTWTGSHGTSHLGSYDPSSSSTTAQDIYIDVPGALSDLVNDLYDLKIGTARYNGSKETEVSLADNEGDSELTWNLQDGTGTETSKKTFVPAIKVTQDSTTICKTEVTGFDANLLRQQSGDYLILDGNF